MKTKTKVYQNLKIQDEERYLEAFTNKEDAETEINLDEFKQVVIENEFIDITELLKEFDEVFIIPHDEQNENFVFDENIQHYHIYIKTGAHNNTIYKKINNIKKIDKQTFIKQLQTLNKTKINFTNSKKLKQERVLAMKKTLLHYNTITTFLNEIPKFSGAVIVKENGEEVALGDRKSGFSKKELENLKNNTSQRVPLYIQYILTLADNLTTEERKKFEEALKKQFGDKVIISNNNAKQIVFTIQNFEIVDDILKIHKITNTHLQILKFLNKNNLNIINMNERKDYVFKNIKYKDEDIENINKYITKPIARTFDDYLEEPQKIKQEVEKQEIKETADAEQKQTEQKEINIEEIKDNEIKTELENINNEIETIKNIKYIDETTKKQIIKELETKKTSLYNKYLEKLEEEKKQQIEKLKKDLQNKEKEVEEIKKQLENLRVENEELREERNKLNDKLEAIQNDINKIKKILELEEDADLNTVIKTLNNKLAEYNRTVDELNTQIKELNNKIIFVENKNKNLIEENEELKEENKKLEESLKIVKKERDERSAIVDKQKEQIEDLEGQIQKKDAKIKSLEEKIENYEKEKEDLEKEIETLKNNTISKKEHNKKLKEAREKVKKTAEKQAKQHIKQHYIKKEEVSKNYVKKSEVEKLEKKLKEVENKNKQIVDLVVKLLDNLDLSEEEKQEIINKFTDLGM